MFEYFQKNLDFCFFFINLLLVITIVIFLPIIFGF